MRRGLRVRKAQVGSQWKDLVEHARINNPDLQVLADYLGDTAHPHEATLRDPKALSDDLTNYLAQKWITQRGRDDGSLRPAAQSSALQRVHGIIHDGWKGGQFFADYLHQLPNTRPIVKKFRVRKSRSVDVRRGPRVRKAGFHVPEEIRHTIPPDWESLLEHHLKDFHPHNLGILADRLEDYGNPNHQTLRSPEDLAHHFNYHTGANPVGVGGGTWMSLAGETRNPGVVRDTNKQAKSLFEGQISSISPQSPYYQFMRELPYAPSPPKRLGPRGRKQKIVYRRVRKSSPPIPSSRHAYREASPSAPEKCTNCLFANFKGRLGTCRLFEREGLDPQIETGHVCDEWTAEDGKISMGRRPGGPWQQMVSRLIRGAPFGHIGVMADYLEDHGKDSSVLRDPQKYQDALVRHSDPESWRPGIQWDMTDEPVLSERYHRNTEAGSDTHRFLLSLDPHHE